MKSNATPAMNNAIGKWISTTCCACLASSTVFGSNGFMPMVRSLHHDDAGHLRVDRTEIGEGPWFGERVGKLFIGVQHFGLKRSRVVRTDHRVRNVILVGPGDGGSDGHRNGGWTKTEIIDLHRRGRRGLLSIHRHVERSGQ